MTCNFAPTPLLQALERNLEQTGKRSVRDCLRSKILPCNEVKEALQKLPIDQQSLPFSSMSVLGYLFEFKTLCLKNASDRSKLPSSLACISKMSTVARFLQFLFEFWLKESQSQENNGAQPNANQSPSINAAEINKMIAQVIQGLTGTVCSILESHSKQQEETAAITDLYTSDSSEAFDAHQVACFVCGSLIRLNHYTRVRPSLLSTLWKAICDIVNSPSLQILPPALTLEATTALLEYLKEGLENVHRSCDLVLQQHYNSQPITIDCSKLQCSHKILFFLIGRLATFLPLDTSCPILPQALAALLTLSGMGPAVKSILTHRSQTLASNANEYLEAHERLSEKVEKTLCTFVKASADGDEHFFASKRLESLLRSTPLSWEETSPPSKLLFPAFAVGNAKLLVKLLHSFTRDASIEAPTQTDVNSTLRICQELIFTTLPLCHEIIVYESTVSLDLVASVIRAVSESLLFCGENAPCLRATAEPGRARFHHLLESWLAPPKGEGSLHPMVHETTICILQLYLLGVSSKARDGLLELLVKHLFDARICTPLRSNITSLLIRIVSGSSSTVKEATVKLLLPELVRRESDMRPEARKKRKRTKAKTLRLADLRLICNVTSHLSCAIPLKGDPPVSTDISGSSFALKHAALRIAVATSVLRSGRNNKADCFAMMDSFLDVWMATGLKSLQLASLVALAESLLGYVRCCFDGDLENGECDRLCQFLNRICFDNRIIDGAEFENVVFGVISALGDVGKKLLRQTSPATLQGLAQTFRRLLSSKESAVQSHAMTALVSFSSSIASEHKTILPSCVPAEMRNLIKCRLNDALDDRLSANEIMEAHVHCAMRLREMSNRHHGFSDRVFPVTSSFCVPVGSIILMMPTQDGRSARVIFPPGPESIEDIKLIHGLDDDDEIPAPVLQRVERLNDGSFKMYLAEQ